MITSKTAPQLSHADLCNRAERWLLKTLKCSVVLKGLTAVTGETPAVIGWRDQHVSHLVACATTLSEFHSDKVKHYRKRPCLGLGMYRYYMCPSGLIMPAELPPKWGLLYVTPTKVRIIVKAERQDEYSHRDEMAMLVSALRRVSLCGALEKIYDASFISKPSCADK